MRIKSFRLNRPGDENYIVVRAEQIFVKDGDYTIIAATAKFETLINPESYPGKNSYRCVTELTQLIHVGIGGLNEFRADAPHFTSNPLGYQLLDSYVIYECGFDGGDERIVIWPLGVYQFKTWPLHAKLPKPVKPAPPPTPRTFEIWQEGYWLPGGSAHAKHLGKEAATAFDEAVRQFVEKQPPEERSCYLWHPAEGYWSYRGRRLFDNEADARERFD